MYYFKGTGREPRFLHNDDNNQLLAHYDQIHQIGTDIQFTNGAWLWKFEGISRLQNDEHFYAVVGGFEYTLYQAVNSTADLGVLMEFMSDDRNTDPTKAPPILTDDDVFFATRLAMNDIQGSEILAGVIIDRNDHSSMLSIEALQRLDNHWYLKLEGLWFLNIKQNTSLSSFKKDGYVTLSMSRYF